MKLTHIPFRQLVNYAYNRLPDRQQCQQIMVHVNACTECRQALAIAWQVAQAATHHVSDAPEMPTNALLTRVLKATYRKQRQPALPSPVAPVPVTLLHDSKVAAVNAGIRGNARERELLFSLGRLDLHLSMIQSENADSYTILGQLFDTAVQTADLEGSQIDLLTDETPLRTVLTDHLGCFRISNLCRGDYGLRITAEMGSSTIEALSLHL